MPAAPFSPRDLIGRRFNSLATKLCEKCGLVAPRRCLASHPRGWQLQGGKSLRFIKDRGNSRAKNVFLEKQIYLYFIQLIKESR